MTGVVLDKKRYTGLADLKKVAHLQEKIRQVALPFMCEGKRKANGLLREKGWIVGEQEKCGLGLWGSVASPF